MQMTCELVHGSARTIPLDDNSVQCAVTSPPYWGLRVYEGVEPEVWGGDPDHSHAWESAGSAEGHTGKRRWNHGDANGALRRTDAPDSWQQIGLGSTCECGAWCGCLGLEPDYRMYVEHIVEVFAEVHRVLRPDGVLWLNMGDSYAGSWGNHGSREGRGHVLRGSNRRDKAVVIPPGPRVALKPKDRMMMPARVAIALQEWGWWLRSEIVWHKPNAMPSSTTDRPTDAHEMIYLLSKSARYYYDGEAIAEPLAVATVQRLAQNNGNPIHNGNRERGYPGVSQTLGVMGSGETRSARTVWSIPTQPYPDAHFATFPEEIPRRGILAGSCEGDLVLDPFCGSGTTGAVALRYGRRFVGVDASAEYLELAHKRINKTQLSLV